MNMNDIAATNDKKIPIDPSLMVPSIEPIFELSESCNSFLCSDVARHEVLEHLKAKNISNIKRRIVKGMRPFLALSGETVRSTFHMCHYFELSDPVKYLALEIFDRFFMNHVSNLHSAIVKKFRNSMNEQWQKVTHRIERQSLLRLLSCIQLASKVTDRNKVLCPDKIQTYLNKNNYKFTFDSIVSSEARVASTLNYELEVLTGYSALETLLGLRRSPKLTLVAPEVFALGVNLLEMLFLRHNKVYDMLFQCIGVSSMDEDEWQVELRRMRCELDNLWVGAAIIVASLHHIDISLQETAIEELEVDLKGVRTEHELRAFAWVINKCFSSETMVNES